MNKERLKVWVVTQNERLIGNHYEVKVIQDVFHTEQYADLYISTRQNPKKYHKEIWEVKP